MEYLIYVSPPFAVVYTNGDVGIDIVFNVYERLQKAYYRKDPRFRLEQCRVIYDDLIKRIKVQKLFLPHFLLMFIGIERK